MHRGPGSMQVVVICTSAEVRRMSWRWKAGRAPGPRDITTRFFAHLRRAIGTVSRISELSPVVAKWMLPRGGLEGTWEPSAWSPVAAVADTAEVRRVPASAQATAAPRRTSLLLTARVYARDQAPQTRAPAVVAPRSGWDTTASSIHTSAPPPFAFSAAAVPPWASAIALTIASPRPDPSLDLEVSAR